MPLQLDWPAPLHLPSQLALLILMPLSFIVYVLLYMWSSGHVCSISRNVFFILTAFVMQVPLLQKVTCTDCTGMFELIGLSVSILLCVSAIARTGFVPSFAKLNASSPTKTTITKEPFWLSSMLSVLSMSKVISPVYT